MAGSLSNVHAMHQAAGLTSSRERIRGADLRRRLCVVVQDVHPTAALLARAAMDP